MLIENFKDLLGSQAVLTDPSDLCRYGKDWLKDYQPNPTCILLPSSVEQVQQIMRICSEKSVSVVPSGGRTGLSGGATATNGEVVLSLERLNKILSISEIDRTVRCEAGVVTQRLQDEVASKGLYFPVDFASKGSSQVGGNVATNAGGIRVIRYGNIRDWVLGMKIVTAGGELLTLNGALFKNQTGYDLKSLMIGSEGTLGIIVELTMKLTTPPGELIRVISSVDQVEKVLPLLARVRASYQNLSAFEFFTHNALEKVCAHHSLRRPFATNYPFYVVMEFERGDAELRNSLEKFYSDALDEEAILDVVMSHSRAQAQEIMAYRELIAETLSSLHTIHKNDISVEVPDIPRFVERLHSDMKREYPDFEFVTFGHIGDGNLHVNIIKPPSLTDEEFFKRCKAADVAVFSMVKEFRGSISAEHGVGLLKRDFLSFSRTPEEIALMRSIKHVFDPKGILNPGKVFA